MPRVTVPLPVLTSEPVLATAPLRVMSKGASAASAAFRVKVPAVVTGRAVDQVALAARVPPARATSPV